MLGATFFLEHLLKLLKASLLKDDLRPEIILGLHLLINALIQADLFVFETGYLTLKLCFIGLLIIRNAFKGVQLLEDLFTFRLQLSGILLSFFKLAGDMIDMSFQSQDLLDVILLLLLMLLELEWGATDFLLSLLHLREKLLVLLTQSLNSVLQSLNLQTWVAIVCQDVLLFDFKSADCLLGPPLFIGDLGILSLKQLVSMWALAELLVDEAVLSCESLYVLGQLSDFLCLQLSDLRLLVDLLSERLTFVAKCLNFLLALEELPLVVVFFANCDAHLVLYVAKLKDLLLKLLLHRDQFLSFLV